MVSGNGLDEESGSGLIVAGGSKRPRIAMSVEGDDEDSPEADGAPSEGMEDKLEFKVGDFLICAVQRGGMFTAKGQVVAIGEKGAPGDYYVHFVDRDRRLDRWVNRTEIVVNHMHVDGFGPNGVNGQNDHLVDSMGVEKGKGETAPEVEIEAKFTRSRRRMIERLNPVSEKEQGSEYVAKMEKAREEKTKIKNFSMVSFAPYEIAAWYYAPFPVPASEDIFICPTCLKYTIKARTYDRHLSICDWGAPPGSRIYVDSGRGVAVYEIDGLINAPYCQRLCLLAKLFLDHKTLYFDVAPFLFYVVTTLSDVSKLSNGGIYAREEVSGFFSKEKNLVQSEYNLACILTLPPHQRKGLGRFMIALSYELTRRESKTGGPERPLSDLGQVSYRAYWNHAIVKYMRRRRGAMNISVEEVAKDTGIQVADVIASLKQLNMMSIWKGEMYVSSSPKVVDEAAKRVSEPRLPLVKSFLKWEDPTKVQRNKDILNTLDNVGKTRRASTSRHPAASPKKKARRNSKSGLIMGAFSEREVNEMKEFVKLYGAERILAPLNSKDGIPSTLVHDLARSMQMSMERCRKKLKRISSQAVEAGLDFYPSDNRLGAKAVSPLSPQDAKDSNSMLNQEANGFSPADEVEDFVMEDGFDRGKVPNGNGRIEAKEAKDEQSEVG